MKLKSLIGIFILLLSGFSNADIQHHNFSMTTCRMFQSGDLQVQGTSETDSQPRQITFSAVTFKEKVVDRYTAMCLAAVSSGIKLRIDYLNCTGLSCVTTTDTSINFYR